MGKHRDLGADMPVWNCWIGLDGALMRWDSVVTRDEYNLPPVDIESGECWKKKKKKEKA